MTNPSQLVLEFEHRTSLGGDDFLVAPCNGEAVGWLDRWQHWPGPALVIYGAAGCGKSHLAQVFLAASGGVRITPEMLLAGDPPTVLGDAPACLIEDAEQLVIGENADNYEHALFHLYNWVHEEGRRMLLSASSPPSRWSIGLADLGSRLRAAAAVEIGAPDDALITAVMVKQFADRQLTIDGDVLTFVQARMERSFAFIRALVEATDKMALAEHRAITVPLMRRVLEQLTEKGT